MVDHFWRLPESIARDVPQTCPATAIPNSISDRHLALSGFVTTMTSSGPYHPSWVK